MFALASVSNTAAIVAAIFAGASTLILAVLSWRASSYKQLLEDIAELFRRHERRREKQDRLTVASIRQVLDEALGKPGGHRWYDPGDRGE